MNRALVWKLVAIMALTLGLVVPLQMTESLIEERRAVRNQVMQDIAQSGTAAQRIDGLVLVLPCTDRYEETETLDNGRSILRVRMRPCDVHVLPKKLRIEAELTTDVRHRGIYQALVYRSASDLDAVFDVPAHPTPASVQRTWGAPRLVLGIGDLRGIRNTPTATWNGSSVAFEAGTGQAPWARGIQAGVPIEPRIGGVARLAMKLDLAGMDRLEIVPAANEVEVKMRSAWPHPSFIGRFSPDTRAVDASGFEATWRTTGLATNIQDAFQRCAGGKCEEYSNSVLGVTLLQGVDVYQKAYRAVHYGFLFVVLTFAVFVLFEVLAGLRVHPIQYGLVGIALTAFYVLLIALAEHVAFGWAYSLAAAACVTLIGAYSRFVLGSSRRAGSMGVLMSLLYGSLYLVLGSEDYALLMGALLLFFILAAFMLAMRRLDWYALPSRANPAAAG